MQLRLFLHSVCLATVVIGSPTLGWAQRTPRRPPPTTQPPATPPATDPATIGRISFDRAVHALEESRFADAALAFEESYRINPVPVVQFNLAYAYRGLGRINDAIQQIERFLAAPGSTPADRVAAAQTELTTLRGLLVHVQVTRTPADAQLMVDGQIATLVGTELVVDPGHHVLELSRDGYRRARREVDWPAQTRTELSFALELVDIAPRLRIEPSIPNAVVTVDGNVLGPGLQEREIASGSHDVRISAEGYVPFQRTIVVGRTGLHRVDAMLTQRRNNSPWPWLAPTIVVAGTAAIVGVSLAIYFAQPGSIPDPMNQWGPPVR